jgi:hypothetical protein
MKRIATTALIGTALVLVLVVGSCTLGVSVEDRLDSFLADLNTPGRADIYLNFHPTETADYAAIQSGSPPPAGPDWDALFEEVAIPFHYENLDPSNTEAVTANVVGTAFSKSVVFKMALDGMDWQIEELTVNGSLEIQ